MTETLRGELTTRTLAMPADANPSGDIFGGWVLSQMDIAAGISAGERAGGRVVTVAVDSMSFLAPVKVGDVLCVYTDIVSIGNTSINILVEAWVQRKRADKLMRVTEAIFKFVALNEEGLPTRVPENSENS
jgi:acyl-CoA thioesterase YciA